jgi:hypothetical protein
VKREAREDKHSDVIENSSSKLSLVQKYGTCLEYLFSLCRKPKKLEYDINESEITKEVEKLKRKKNKVDPLLPPPLCPKTKTLVLDLDETLIHSSFKKTKNYDFTVQIEVKGEM